MAQRFREITGPGYPPVVWVWPTFSSHDIFLLNALCRESLDSPRIAILFSGGIDCTLIAYLSHLSVAELFNPRKNLLNQIV